MSRPDPFARSAALWLRAYPRRWRADRAVEVTEVLRDLAAPGTTRVDARTALGLVRAGWGTRWRERPPAGVYLRYRLLGRRPAAAWDGWLRDDVDGPLYPLRYALDITTFVALGTSAAMAAGLTTYSRGFFAVYVPVLLVGLTFVGASRRRRTRDELFPPPPEGLDPFGPYVPLRLDGRPDRRPSGRGGARTGSRAGDGTRRATPPPPGALPERGDA